MVAERLAAGSRMHRRSGVAGHIPQRLQASISEKLSAACAATTNGGNAYYQGKGS
jgi:hypothetical protein